MIEKYDFGRIVIDGKEYTEDLKVFPSQVKPGWWRERGHLLQSRDITDVLEFHLDLLVIGTGYHGNMELSAGLKEILDERGIVHVESESPEAVDIFNHEDGKAGPEEVIGIFHLTC
ncbi:hypothetical protein GF325_06105 [Candidatus Bathyarchaeota archaeon]|nr:hypothetical protein [Candidatus Bathyarchaeota archaeon]